MNQKNVRTLSPQELQDLYMATESERDYMLIKTAAKHGLRNSETVSLQSRHIDLENKRIDIRDSKEGKDRVIPIPKSFQEELKIYTKELSQQDYLFPSRRSETYLTPRAFQKKVRKYSLRAELYPSGITEEDVKEMPYQDRIMPHSLRHTYATQLLKSGVKMAKISRLLGHESVKTTVDEYGHLKIRDLRDVINRVKI